LKSEAVGREVECEIVNPDRISELCPMVRTDDLEGGLWVPGDCVANPLEICLALSILAQEQGVTVVPNCEVGTKQNKLGPTMPLEGPVNGKTFGVTVVWHILSHSHSLFIPQLSLRV
jgi:hypothetical protein